MQQSASRGADPEAAIAIGTQSQYVIALLKFRSVSGREDSEMVTIEPHQPGLST
jgi:hypothetical protein